MGRNSKQRRDARKRKAARGPVSRDGRFHQDTDDGGAEFWTKPDPADGIATVPEMFRTALLAGAGRRRDPWLFDRTIAQLAALTPRLPGGYVDHLLGDAVAAELGRMFDRGWQPAELVHVVGRKTGAAEVRLLIAHIGAHAVQNKAFDIAPRSWVDQLEELGVPRIAGGPGAVHAVFRSDAGVEQSACWRPAMLLLGHLGTFGRLPSVGVAPGDWGSGGARSVGGRTSDSTVLARIRGLLAKAESSEFAAEAELLTAKAQDLMTRHAIRAAVLDASDGVALTEQVEQRRVILTTPYPEAKASLLNGVAGANGVKAISHVDWGLMSIVGMPVDLELVELLFTSLLIQATNAVREAGRETGRRKVSFRRSFLLAYAQRVRERLEAAREGAAAEASARYGKELVPVLAERDEAVNSVFSEAFPGAYTRSSPVTNRAGWVAGRAAAEFADLTGGRGRLTRGAA